MTSGLLSRDLRGYDLLGTNFSGATLDGSNFIGANMNGAKFDGASMQRVAMGDLLGAGSSLARASLARADLTGAILTNIDAVGANLSGANLTNVNLTAATLKGVDLRSAILTGAVLNGANLSLANLTGLTVGTWIRDLGSLEGANLTDTKWPWPEIRSVEGLNLTGVNLTRVVFDPALDMRGVNFTEANLTGGRAGRGQGPQGGGQSRVTGLGLPRVVWHHARRARGGEHGCGRRHVRPDQAERSARAGLCQPVLLDGVRSGRRGP